ncbi:MAG: protein kinase domain-containing protein [Candidatus Eiseniibacteriota bacterium]
MNRLMPGTNLGPYTIVAPLGAGGMGEVYRARDPRLDRDVALKVLPAAVANDPDRLARFEREARTVAALNHPHIVTIHSIEQADGIRFLTMELVEGESLDRIVPSGGMTVARAVDLAIGVADALARAHEKAIVHRDLKPANVMVTSDGRVKVLDFGLAKPEERPERAGKPRAGGSDALTIESPLSMAGQVMGTAPYMAPEQIRGESVDGRADLFAFGIIFYELVTGERPFTGATFADVSSAILRDTPRPARKVRADLPADIERLIGRCLEKDREQRIQSAAEVRKELERVRQLLASGPRIPASVSEGPSIAVLPFTNMSADPENEYFSDGLTEEMLNVLAKNPGLRVAGRTSSFAFKGKNEDLREIGQKLGVATLLEGSVRRAGNRVRITAQLVKAADGFHLWSETYDRVLDDIFAVQDDIAQSVAAAMNVALLGRSSTTGHGDGETYDLFLQARHLMMQGPGPSLVRAGELLREVLERSPENARAWAELARVHATRAAHGFSPVLEGYGSARKAVESALALDDKLPQAYEVLAYILSAFEHRWAESAAALEQARALAPGDGGILSSSAIGEAIAGNLEKAFQLSARAIKLDPLNAYAHQLRARVLEWCRRDREAEIEYRTALELSPGIVMAHTFVGRLLVLQGRHKEGLETIAKELSSGYRNYGLAMAHHEIGDREASDRALAALLAEGEDWAFQIACAHAARGEKDAAFEWLERAYFLRDSGIPLTALARPLESLHTDPRWPKFLDRIGLRPVAPPASPLSEDSEPR